MASEWPKLSARDSCSWYTACGRFLAYLSLIQPNSQLHFRVPAADLFPLLLQNTRHILPSPAPPGSLPTSYYLLASPSLYTPPLRQLACQPPVEALPEEVESHWVISFTVFILANTTKTWTQPVSVTWKQSTQGEGLMKVTGGKHKHWMEIMLDLLYCMSGWLMLIAYQIISCFHILSRICDRGLIFTADKSAYYCALLIYFLIPCSWSGVMIDMI